MSKKDVSTLDLIYHRAVKSYEIMVGRIDAQDRKILLLIGWSSGITAASPALAKIPDPCLDMPVILIWIIPILILVLFAWTIVIGMRAAFSEKMTRVRLTHPKILLEDQWVNLTSEQFKRFSIEKAGDSFDKNKSIVHKKWIAAYTMAILISFEALCIFFWAFFTRLWL